MVGTEGPASEALYTSSSEAGRYYRANQEDSTPSWPLSFKKKTSSHQIIMYS
jgi:hypothetical protein